MAFEPGKTYHGFRFDREKKIGEINSTGRIFVHEKSGARFLSISNEDDNKVFSISFRTPPPDSTGIPHILEHSVLCGSKKYPSKEPFVELVKGSLNTFLNAMTFPDKTMYPVASRNRKDFFNLMDVYLDAVFHPNIYSVPQIFMQEGWHYEIEDTKGRIAYRGVVYNEMKGVFSTPEAVLFRKIPESLFPETPYSRESGGDPDVITGLTLEKFLDFHRRYYHPANSYIYFYGDGDIDELLRFLDRSYLNEFNTIEVDSTIQLQKPFAAQNEMVVFYPIMPNEDENNRGFLSMNFVVDFASNPEIYLAGTILEYLLLETPAAPLKKALMDRGIGKDVFGHFERDILQPVFSVVVKGSSEDKKSQFVEVLFETLNRLVKNGIDRDIVEAAINIHEFRLREADYKGLPKGLVYGMVVMGSWLYDGDPFVHLEYERSLSIIKKALSEPYFESLIERYLLKNTHRSLVMVLPQKGLAEKKELEVQKKLDEFKKGLSEEELKKLVEETEELKKRQMTPDPKEYIEKIPMLSLKDIDRKAEHLPFDEREEQGVKVLSHPIFTSGIIYMNLYFDSRAVRYEDLPYLSLLSRLLGRINTDRYSYSDLSNYINIHTGGVYLTNESFGDKDEDETYFPKMAVKSKALVKKLPELCDIVGEITARSRYDDVKRLREIVQETKSRFEMSIYDQGHLLASSRLLSYFSHKGRYAERLGGIDFFHFICDLERNFDKQAEEVLHRLKTIAGLVFIPENLTVSVTADEHDYGLFRKNFSRLLGYFEKAKISYNSYPFELKQKNEGLLTPGNVQYVAKGFNFRRLGHGYSDSLQVLRTIASLDYLWNRVRVRGGAYGCFARFSRDGNMYFCSYRDPNLSETLDVYDGAADFIRSFDAEDKEITKYIIGTISRFDRPLTPSMKGETAAGRYFQNISHEDVQQAREGILQTGKQDIRAVSDLVADAMKQNYFCVLGSEGKIREHEGLFENLVDVFR